MRFIRKSSGDEYAHSFWVREFAKPNGLKERMPFPSSPLEQLKKPVEQEGHPYKLPPPELRRWGIWLLTTPAEMEALLVIQDSYMETHDLIVKPPTLGNVTRRAIETGYFSSPKEGTQYKLFQKWKDGILADCIKGDDRLCLQAITDEERLKSPTSLFYIKDGWGRSLPYLALVYLSHEFFPIEVYIAE